ncbi:hypothetical protein FRX31_025319 [Thalictrum thalictroides]|uniref:Transmembrane protein n=1 Tax=Thalictrum thalictroides TaxID=46969 RepID=A0A7J6VLT8_THATH|nr:hypothetical protein FRX31_025319 [Thalictrum thalictroides]
MGLMAGRYKVREGRGKKCHKFGPTRKLAGPGPSKIDHIGLLIQYGLLERNSDAALETAFRFSCIAIGFFFYPILPSLLQYLRKGKKMGE